MSESEPLIESEEAARWRRARHGLFGAAAVFVAMFGLSWLCGCSSVDSKFGSYNRSKAEYVPSHMARECKADSDCVEVDYGCNSCCPGGAAVNTAHADAFKRYLKIACDTEKPKASSNNDCICVKAPLHCLKGLCTWDYDGPDPSKM